MVLVVGGKAVPAPVRCGEADRGLRDAEGYFFYRGRDDDVINSAGYRICNICIWIRVG